ncbi:MAG TPA: glycosyltransferase [Vicinamibacterales bacterium]|nr:glycosyltransferase [Vicinamibacterales bacterium]
MPINILHLRDTHEIGGPGKTILETFRAIDASRFRMHLGVFLTRNESDNSPFLAAARECGMPVHLIRGYNQFDPLLVWRVADLVKRLQIDIVSAHEVKSDVIAFLSSKIHRVPIVTTLHGWIFNSTKQRLFTELDKRIVRRFDRAIVVSEKIRDDLAASGVPADRLRLLKNAIVVEKYRRSGQRGYLAELLKRPIPGPVLASIGRLSAEKGHADLIDALGIAAQQGRRVLTVLAGDGPERQPLEQKVRALGLQEWVCFPGYVSQPARVLEETDLMVLPSHTEGLPNAALEALVMEVPVLATRVGGTPEVITDGVTGRLVEPHDPEALARAIVDFLAAPASWQRLAAAGREMVETQFNFQLRTRRLEQIYEELARVS